ncbi:MAG: enoyl-CoA hydratase-related protein [Acidimicrobiaceae bacterium]|nr:enoyl-CoA hydratase-related protein [Acidimicrobiaceae bacterium]
MGTPTLSRDGDLLIIDFGDGENRTDVAWVETMNVLLDEAEEQALKGPAALITTAGSAKHYSNGLDVDFIASASSSEVVEYVSSVEKVLARILTFPAPTVAAVNGHAFGAGAFVILAHDYAVMRADRGFVCWPEVHLQMTFNPGLLAMIHDLMSNSTAREAVTIGRRYGGPDAVAAGIVNDATSLDQLIDAASDYGRAHAATAGPNLRRIKRQLYRSIIKLLGTA